MPDQFPYVGISTVRLMSPVQYEAVTEKHKVVDNVSYDIYLSGRTGYIQMKKSTMPSMIQDAKTQGREP